MSNVSLKCDFNTKPNKKVAKRKVEHKLLLKNCDVKNKQQIKEKVRKYNQRKRAKE